LSHIGKLNAKILETRIKPLVEPQLNKAQFGFRRGKSCSDALFTLRQLSEKAIEYNKQLNIAFIDQEKAFDRVDRDKLWAILNDYGVQGQLLDNIRALYQICASVVRTNDDMTDECTISTGVRQVLSPLLFNIYIDRTTSEANQEGYSNSQLTPRS
jgi:retron-type reverse transcriptase